MQMKIETRISIESRIVKKIVEDALAQGFSLSVFDGEDWSVNESTNKTEILDNLQACDEENLYFYKDGKQVGGVLLVYGNDGYDVICDYHTNLETVLAGANKLASTLEERHG